MRKIAIVTDSNSGISQMDAERMGVFVLPMPFTIDGKEYFEGILYKSGIPILALLCYLTYPINLY